MGITAETIRAHGLIDGIIPEPLGGAHRDIPQMAARIKHQLIETLHTLQNIPQDQLLALRYQKYRTIGGE